MPAACEVFGPLVPTSSFGPPSCSGGGPTGNVDSVTFSPDHTRFITFTRSAMSRIVWVARSAPAAW